MTMDPPSRRSRRLARPFAWDGRIWFVEEIGTLVHLRPEVGNQSSQRLFNDHEVSGRAGSKISIW